MPHVLESQAFCDDFRRARRRSNPAPARFLRRLLNCPIFHHESEGGGGYRLCESTCACSARNRGIRWVTARKASDLVSLFYHEAAQTLASYIGRQKSEIIRIPPGWPSPRRALMSPGRQTTQMCVSYTFAFVNPQAAVEGGGLVAVCGKARF